MRSISQAFIDAFLSRETGEAALILLEVNHEDLPTPVRLALNTKPITHQGGQYEPMYFEVSFPEQIEDRATGVKLRVDGVDRTLIEKVRSFSTPPTVVFKVVATTDLDQVEMETAPMFWRTVTYGTHWLEGDVESPEIFNRNFPADAFTPAIAPGLFREF